MSTPKKPLTITVEDNGTAIARGGVRVAFNDDGTVDVYGAVPVKVHAAVSAKAPPDAKTALRIGHKMHDGTTYAGISPVTGKPMYALPADAPLTMRWRQAMEYAANFEGFGHSKGSFRVPAKSELDVLFQNKAKIGGFNESGSHPAGWYWSSTEDRGSVVFAWGQRFSDGDRDWPHKSLESSLRLVRD